MEKIRRKKRNILFGILFCLIIGMCQQTAPVFAKETVKKVKSVLIRERECISHLKTENGNIILYVLDGKGREEAICYSKNGKFQWRVKLPDEDASMKNFTELTDGKILVSSGYDNTVYVIDGKKENIVEYSLENYFTQGEYQEYILCDKKNGYLLVKVKRIKNESGYPHYQSTLVYFDENKQKIEEKQIALDGSLVPAGMAGNNILSVDKVDRTTNGYLIVSESFETVTGEYGGYYVLETDEKGQILQKWVEQEYGYIKAEPIGGYSLEMSPRAMGDTSHKLYRGGKINGEKIVKKAIKEYGESIALLPYKSKFLVLAGQKGMIGGRPKQGIYIYGKTEKLEQKLSYTVREYLTAYRKAEMLDKNIFVSIASGLEDGGYNIELYFGKMITK